MGTFLSSVGSRLWTSYNRSLSTHPVLTKSFTSFTGFILGDGIAQLATKPLDQYDYKRTARFATFAFCIHAPGCHLFYKALDASVFPGSPKSPKAIVAKIIVDQLMFTPFSICVFYSAIKILEGRASQIKQTIKEKFWPTLFAGYAIWPLAHIINFRFISNQHRVLYINVVQVGWNVVLCKIATAGSDTEKPKLKKSDSDSSLQDLENGLDHDKTGTVQIATSRR